MLDLEKEIPDVDEDGYLVSKRDSDATVCLDLIKQIKSTAGQVPENPAAEEFADSIVEKALSFQETIERMGRASPKQVAALENMLYGLEKWVR